jgi:aminotransferase in exopolysaccharide biosynthesis
MASNLSFGDNLVGFVRDIYRTNEFIPLHEPTFSGNEKKYVLDTIESTFVSSVGKYVDDFERRIEAYTGCGKAVATVNGSAALHVALHMAGVRAGDLVLTQALTFVATCNAIFHMGANPVFIDVSKVSLGLCPIAMEAWLDENAFLKDNGECFYKDGKQRIKAVVPMHTFGHPVQMDELLAVCLKWNITVIEDAAESLGSLYKGKHTGTLGEFGAVSFNGNKIITAGGGGMALCKDVNVGMHAKHVTTTAKAPHPYEFYHDEPGFNYRMPNLNAALGCAQMEALPALLQQKRGLAGMYKEFFAGTEYRFVSEPSYGHSNYWLNAIMCPDQEARNNLLELTNSKGVMTRPVWALMTKLPMFKNAMSDELSVSKLFEEHLINLPSTPVN